MTEGRLTLQDKLRLQRKQKSNPFKSFFTKFFSAPQSPIKKNLSLGEKLKLQHKIRNAKHKKILAGLVTAAAGFFIVVNAFFTGGAIETKKKLMPPSRQVQSVFNDVAKEIGPQPHHKTYLRQNFKAPELPALQIRRPSKQSVIDEVKPLIRRFEGFLSTPEVDSDGLPSIGYGHKKGVTLGMGPIDRTTAERFLAEDLSPRIDYLFKTVDKKELSSKEWAVLLDIIYNWGDGGARFFLDKVNNGQIKRHEIPDEVMRYTTDINGKELGGLKRRAIARARIARQGHSEENEVRYPFKALDAAAPTKPLFEGIKLKSNAFVVLKK